MQCVVRAYLASSRAYDLIFGFGSIPCVASQRSLNSFIVEVCGVKVSKGKFATLGAADGEASVRSTGDHAVADGGYSGLVINAEIELVRAVAGRWG